MLGRSKIIERLWNDLTKPTPSHLSVVGPRFSGKTVLVHGLRDRMHTAENPYVAVVIWDLGHKTPSSDQEFMVFLCQTLGEGLKAAGNEYGDHMLSLTSGDYTEIAEVMDAIDDEGAKVLMLWDGFDKPLSGGTLTRNLWDNLLDLCRKPSFRLVTSTRKELHHLIRDEKSVTSDFWGVFQGIVRIGKFDSDDVDEILTGLTGLEFKAGAKTELENWSGSLPPLLLETLNQIVESNPSGQIDNTKVNELAASATSGEKLARLLASLWADCTAGEQDLYRILVERGELSVAETGKEERRALLELGIALQSGSKIRPTCRMLQEHIKGDAPDAGSMARLFGTWDGFRSNIRSLLERRLAHIAPFDERLLRLVGGAIADIPDFPDDCLNNLTNIRERALNLIWLYEFGVELTTPEQIVAYWTTSPRVDDNLVQDMMRTAQWAVPSDPLRQIRLLGLLTGSMRNFESKARAVSKDTYVLLSVIHSFRNRAEHSDGQPMDVGVAVAAIMACLELLVCLERELQT